MPSRDDKRTISLSRWRERVGVRVDIRFPPHLYPLPKRERKSSFITYNRLPNNSDAKNKGTIKESPPCPPPPAP